MVKILEPQKCSDTLKDINTSMVLTEYLMVEKCNYDIAQPHLWKLL